MQSDREWEDLSDNARDTMEGLGNFGPTSNPLNAEVKGYVACEPGEDGRTYYGPDDLREIAAGCIEVADWLDARRAAAQLAQAAKEGV